MHTKTVFERNLDALQNSKITEELREHEISTDVKLANANCINLTYNGVLLHNEKSPLGEAKAIFDNNKTGESSLTVLYGIGLGYLFQYWAKNTKGVLILYEPNLDILKMAFKYVDFSNELKKQNIYVTTDKETLHYILRAYMGFANKPDIVCLPSYKKIFQKQIETDSKELTTIVGTIMLDCNYTQERFFPIVSAIFQNMPYLVNEPPICTIKDMYKGKTAVVCSAGPTLAENIETLKKYRNNVVILCVGPAYKSLIDAGITPDFLCIIEDRNCIGQVKGLDISNTNLILEPSTHIEFHKLKAKKTFLHIPSNCPPYVIWSELTGQDISEYQTRGTVSFCALNCARILGCSRIVLAGQDLAFLDGQVYSKDSIYKDLKINYNKETQKFEITADNIEEYAAILSQNEDADSRLKYVMAKLSNYKQRLTTIKSITGEMIPTEAVYTTFAINISRYTKSFPDIEYINTSLRGAQLDGYLNIPMEDALKETVPIEKKEFKEVLNICDKAVFLSGLKNYIQKLNEAENKVSDLKKYLARIKTEYIRHKALTKDLLLYLKKFITGYTYLSIDYAKENKLFDLITKKEQMLFETLLYNSESIDLNIALKMLEFQKQYVRDSLEHINNVRELIKEDIDFLSEG